MKIHFHEIQKFTQWWLWLILITTIVAPIIALVKHYILSDFVVEDTDESDSMIIFAAIMLFVMLLFAIIKLETEIDEKEIRMKFFPFINKKIPWSAIKNVRVLNYGFVGGWGIRLFTNYGTLYNVKGNKGLAIQLQNGKRLLIGTQKEDELRAVIEKLQK